MTNELLRYVSRKSSRTDTRRENDVVINLTDATSEEASLTEIEDIFVLGRRRVADKER